MSSQATSATLTGMSASRPYAGVSPDERRLARRQKFLDAAQRIMGSEGYDALTVRRLAAEAQTAPRFFYESFDDVPAVAREVHRELMERVFDAAQAAHDAAPPDLRARMRAAIGITIDMLTRDPIVGRIVLSTAPPLTKQMRAGLSRLIRETSFFAFQARESGPATEQLAETVGVMIGVGSAELTTRLIAGNLPYDAATLADIVTDSIIVLASGLPDLPDSTTAPAAR